MTAQLIQLATPRTIPAVTVLMPHFGCERFVAAAAASILSQSFDDLELWIMDDASPSIDWLAALEPFRADPRLRLFASDVNVGTYRLKTLAIGAVESGMIAFQDSDDVSEPERIAFQLQALARRRLDIVGCAYRIIDADDRVVGQRRMPRWCNWVERLGKTHFIHHPTSLVRSSVFDKVGAFDGTTRIGADTDFILRAAQRVRIGNIAQPLYRYRQHPDSLTAAAETGYGSPSREHYVALTRSRWREARRAGSDVVLAPPPIDVAFTLNEIAP